MGAHQDLVQGAVIGISAVVGAGHHRTLNGFVGMAIHMAGLLCFGFGSSMSSPLPRILKISPESLAFFPKM